MKTIKLFFLIVLFIFTAYSFQSSSETVNPFNQFMSPSGGVNLFSGDAAFTQPITSISGRGGMNAGVTLGYSSNVYLNVRSKNDIASTTWVGLGWNLNYGSVVCDHKGTKSLADDDYYWITPAGFTDQILKKNGKFYAKTDPYTKITRVVSATDSNIIIGWIFTGIDGKKVKYGDFNNNAGTSTHGIQRSRG